MEYSGGQTKQSGLEPPLLRFAEVGSRVEPQTIHVLFGIGAK